LGHSIPGEPLIFLLHFFRDCASYPAWCYPTMSSLDDPLV